LYAVDLYNFGYWWESHEVLEGLWHACGRRTTAGNYFQALIQFAAAHLKRALGNEVAAHNLARSGLLRLQNSPASYMGLDTVTFAHDVTVVDGGPQPARRAYSIEKAIGNGPSVNEAP
jgi:predicted metal-dependent hydrolase